MAQPTPFGKPLDPLEVPEPDEDVLTEEILAAMRRVVAQRDGDGPQLRGAHTKAHCTLSARVDVPELPEALRHGVFAQPGSYAAWIRTSSAPDRAIPDRLPNVRGLAIKLLGVPVTEAPFLADPSLAPEPGGLDFVLITADVVPFGTVRSFRDMIVANVEGRGASWFRGREGLERAKITAEIVSGHTALLGLTFYSSTPARFGPHVVKLRARAITPVTETSWHPEDALRRATIAQLAEGPVILELAVQRQRDPVAQPIEDASVPWREEDCPFEPVARIEIPPQPFDTADRDAFGEGLSFDSWHTVSAHRPLGGLNRVRAAVYAELAAVRLASRGRPTTVTEGPRARPGLPPLPTGPPPLPTDAPRGAARPVCLPDADPDPAARARDLAARRAAFQEDPNKLAPLVMCAGAPDAGRPTIGWALTAGSLSVEIAMNIVANQLAAMSRDGEPPEALVVLADAEQVAQKAFGTLLADAAAAVEAHRPPPAHVPPFEELRDKVDARLRGVLIGGMGEGLQIFEESSPLYAYRSPDRRGTSLDDQKALYRRIPASPAEIGLDDDLLFARRRLVGPNAPFLRRVTAVPDAFAVRDAHLRAVTGPDDSLARAGAEGRLFLCDYTGLAAALTPKNASDGTPMFLFAPYLLLAVPPVAPGAAPGALRPVAIQCAPEPGPQNPVLGPADGWRWKMAQKVVETADICWFEPITHLGLTHLLLEPAALATFRELAPNHPMARLLLPHVEGTLSVNDMAVHHLLADGGAIDQTFAATMASIRRVAADTAIAHDLRGDTLPALLARQGLDDRAVLADHPWRDDALRVHGAIGRWVDGYVRQAYRTDADLLADRELRGWAAALGRPATAGGLTGFGTITTRADLTTVVTELVFTASAGHAAVNFPQWTDAGFAARMTGAGWGPGPGAKEATEQDWLAMVPPLQKAELHAEFLYLLGSLHHTKLGVYDTSDGPWFTDPAVSEGLLPAFQAELRVIEAEIDAANTDPARRAQPYTHLSPPLIPQSINV